MKTCALFIAGLILLTRQGCQTTARQNNATGAGRPNIVLIMADDLGYGDIGCYGQQLIHTPHIDSLAREGMRFTQFYAGCPVCAPSRSVLMTGMHSGHTPIRGNKEIQPEGQWPLPDSVTTLSTLLQRAGYATGAFGKWGLGFIGTEGDPVKRGFDEFFGYNCQREAHNYYPDHLWWNDTRIDYPNTVTRFENYSAQIIQDSALAFIDKNKSRSFFLFLPYTLPHAALQVPDDSIYENYKKQFNETPVAVPAEWNGKGYAPQAYPHAAYATMVTRLDNYVGQVVAKLHALGIDKNTLVIFTSDNGPHKEGGNNPGFFNSNAGFRGMKRDVYEGGIREPMIAYWPEKVRAGSESAFIGAFWDFMPTFISLTGASAPRQQMDGVSFLPTLLGKKDQQKQHPYLYWEFHEGGGKQAVRIGEWKGIRLRVNAHPDAVIQLYNIHNDPGESNDIAASHPDIVRKMKQTMREAHVENPMWPFFAKK